MSDYNSICIHRPGRVKLFTLKDKKKKKKKIHKIKKKKIINKEKKKVKKF